MISKWSLLSSLVFLVNWESSSVFAQEPHPLQPVLQGLWVEDNVSGTETLEQRRFISVAESNLRDPGEVFRASYQANADTSSCLMAGALAGEAADFEILDQGETIDLSAFGRTRRVYMDFWLEPPQTFEPNGLGWSTARWAGDMLVIRTTHFLEGAIKSGERPLPFGGPIAQMVERYTLSEDATHMSLQVFRSDPKYYIAPINMRQEFIRSDRTISTIDCLPRVPTE